jgi:hypothetical protein
MHKHTKAIALVAGLLILAGQSLSLVHAADHPFHAPDEVCAAFASFDHNAHAFAVLPCNSKLTQFEEEIVFCSEQKIIHKTSLQHQPRAPPQHT